MHGEGRRRRQLGIRDRLKEVDPVADVRFASVYRQFADVEEFEDELSRLEREPPLPRGQYPLDDQLFQTLDADSTLPGRASLRALPAGREGSVVRTPAQQPTARD